MLPKTSALTLATFLLDGRKYRDVSYIKRDPCAYCGRAFYQIARSKRSKEHVIPRSQGGKMCFDSNIVSACSYCNEARQNAPLLHWLWAFNLIGDAKGAAKIILRSLK